MELDVAVARDDLALLCDQYDALLAAQWAKEEIGSRLVDVGRLMGDLLVGEAFAGSLTDSLRHGPRGFTLCWVRDTGISVAGLPWETLVLPGSSTPLLFDPVARGALEFVREHQESALPSGRRVEAKCLAAWSHSPSRDLLVETEIDDLRRRLLSRPGLRFRWLVDPGIEELRSRLRLECALFLFAGHGRLDGRAYEIEIGTKSVDVSVFADALASSRAEVLVFDSCESGHGDASTGLPSWLSSFPSATCLLGMKGPGNDIISAWYMPTLVERLLLGEPVWSVVGLLRILLYDQGTDAWHLPVIHLKRSYRPLAEGLGQLEDVIAKHLEDNC